MKQKIIDALKNVYDPEIPINVYDLGLIYEINVDKKNNVDILMSLTSPTCPTADLIKEMIKDEIEEIKGVGNVKIELTFEPAWTPERVNADIREELGLSNFGSDEIKVEKKKVEKICFNCGITDDKYPIIDCFFKGAKTTICSKCLVKLN